MSEISVKESKLNKMLQSETWYNFKHSWTARIGSFLILSILLIALIGPLFVPQDPYDLSELSLENA